MTKSIKGPFFPHLELQAHKEPVKPHLYANIMQIDMCCDHFNSVQLLTGCQAVSLNANAEIHLKLNMIHVIHRKYIIPIHVWRTMYNIHKV